jgi:hypothetical protein
VQARAGAPTPARNSSARLHPNAQRVPQPQSARPYLRHEADKTGLYQIVSQHLETFLDEVHDHYDKPLPAYVERELREFLKCGLLPYGFLRARCKTCGQGLLVALSCKRRGVCLSCNARCMCGTAAAPSPAHAARDAKGHIPGEAGGCVNGSPAARRGD